MWELISANRRKAMTLVVVMAAILLILGYTLGFYFTGDGTSGLFIAFLIWFVLMLISYFGGDSILLGLSGARRIESRDHPVLHNVIEEMKIAAALPKIPDVYIIDDPAPNAFATGRKPETSSIAVTSGLLETLNRDELQGVIAHEVAHIKNRDVLYMMLVGVMMGTIVLLADVARRYLFWGGGRSRRRTSRESGQAQAILLMIGIVLMILAPIMAQLIYFAVSRRKEYLADACGAVYTRYPEGLASALEKIATKPIKLHSASRVTAPMYIVNPLNLSAKGLADLSSTHPPISERIKILRSMAGGAAYTDYEKAFRKVTGRPVGVIPFTALNKAEPITARPTMAPPGAGGPMPVVPPSPTAPGPLPSGMDSPLQRMRMTTDLLWKLNQFSFIACGCGTKLKIPPVYAGKVIECPHCLASHQVPARVTV